jgi:DNA-binding IclR family transcriptional regulator
MAKTTAPGKASEAAKKKSGGDNQYLSRAVVKSLKVLEILQSAGAPMGLQEVSRRLQLSKTSTIRLLRTLEAAACLVSTGQGEYNLAPGMRSVVPTIWLARLLRVAETHMLALNVSLRETVSLGALFDNRVEVVAVLDSPETIKMCNVVGHIVPPNASSLGKVIAALQNAERREKLFLSYGFWRFTERSITDRSKLEEEFRQIRSEGYATDREESVMGGICFGVPVYDPAGEVHAALSTSVPKMRVRDSGHEKNIIAALKATSDKITKDFRLAGATSASLGHRS